MDKDIKIIKCPFCTFDIWVVHNERFVICNHCRQTVDILIWNNLEKYKNMYK